MLAIALAQEEAGLTGGMGVDARPAAGSPLRHARFPGSDCKRSCQDCTRSESMTSKLSKACVSTSPVEVSGKLAAGTSTRQHVSG